MLPVPVGVILNRLEYLGITGALECDASSNDVSVWSLAYLMSDLDEEFHPVGGGKYRGPKLGWNRCTMKQIPDTTLSHDSPDRVEPNHHYLHKHSKIWREIVRK